jgi:UDP-N-acetylmuramoylalanine--D-glutamate ligase
LIPVTTFRAKRVALFGLGGSGLATAKALAAGGARVHAFDDNPQKVEEARQAGIEIADPRIQGLHHHDALVLSPGVPLTHPAPHWAAKLALEAGIEIIGDIELFVRQRRAVAPVSPFVAITGTNGKSTTTALIAHVLRAAGRDVQMGGNIGTAILSLEPPAAGRIHVVECSSYQIDLAPSLDPTVGILLNITPDHLDRHGSMENYAGIKERLVAKSDTAIVGTDDSYSAAVASFLGAKGRKVVRISNTGRVENGVYLDGTKLVSVEGKAHETVADLAEAPALRGAHNAQNAAAAFAACRALGLGAEEIRAGLASFPGLAHRMEPVRAIGGVRFVNDSKATNADAAQKALSSFDRIYWIAGGLAKEGGIGALEPYFRRIEKAYLVGDAAPMFAATLGGKAAFEISGTIAQAVRQAARDAVSKGGEAVVLLSPACASFDQFRNFEERGNAFREAVLALEEDELKAAS